MKKIKLTPPEKKACRDVIAFWKKVEKRLVAGEKADRGIWLKTNLLVASYPDHDCPLCVVARNTKGEGLESTCSYCVYQRIYGIPCLEDDGHLHIFESNSNLRTCQSAIQAVERILANSEAR